MSEVVRCDDQTIVKPGENIVASMAQEFRKELLPLVTENSKELVVDLTDVTMIDSIGIGILVATFNSISKYGGKFTVTNVSKDIYNLLKTMRLDQHFEVRMVQ